MTDEVLKTEQPDSNNDNQEEKVIFEPEEEAPRKHPFKKFFNKIKTYFSNPSNVIIIVFAIFLSVMVLYPLGKMIFSSFVTQTSAEVLKLNETYGLELEEGDFTFMMWPYTLFNPDPSHIQVSQNLFWIPMGRSILMALLACLIAITVGGTLAFLISRTNIPFKKVLSTIFVFPYIMPSWSMAMFWENFFKNNVASSQIGLLQSLTGICVPIQLIYGFWPTAIVLGIHYAPFAYILIGGILRNMDANLEEAATILKASRFKILRRITIPIVAPAMISTILLVFSSSISSFTVPAFLNKDGSFRTISIVLRNNLSSSDGRGSGYVIATILMLFSILILSINNWFTKSRRSFTTVSGKSGQINKINLGKIGKWIVATVVLLFVLFFAVVPLITFVIESLESNHGDISSISTKYWFSPDAVYEDAYIEARGYSTKGLFFNDTIMNSFGRSVLLATIVALICGTIGILIGYAVSKNRRSRIANYVSSLAFLPYLIPALCFSSVFFSVIKSETFQFLDVTTTFLESSAIIICVIVGGIKFLPFASRSGTNAMLQLSGEIEEAAIINGCPWIKRMFRIIFPIQKASFISGFLLPFISCMREYTLFVLLTSDTTLIVNTLNYYSRNGADQLANGMNLLIVLFVIVVNLLVNWVTGASIDKGIGG